MLNGKKAKTIQTVKNDTLKNKSRVLFSGLPLKVKEEKGSITLFVLVTMLFFITVLILSYSGQTNKIIAQEKQVEEIQREYNTANIDEVYHEVENKIPLTTLNSVIITFDYNAGTGGKITNKKFINTQLGTLPNSPSREGYTFEGWYTGQTNGEKINTKTIVPTSNTTYYAHWKTIEYNITYQLNGGTNHSDNPSKYTIEDAIILKDPTKTGYKFNGWSKKEGDIPEKGLEIPKGSTGNKLYIANYEAKQLKISLDAQNATSKETEHSIAVYEKYATGIYLDTEETKAMTTSTNNVTVPSRSYTLTYDTNGGDISEGTTTTKASYTFGGYYTDTNGKGTQMISNTGYITNSFKNTSYSDNTTLYAKWTRNDFTLAMPTRTGYTFAGWYTEISGGEEITGTSTITSDQTVYAHWTANTYTVHYNGNGSTGGSTANSIHTYDKEEQLSTNGFTRSYTVTYNDGIVATEKIATYTFKNWNTKADGSGISYNDNASIRNLTTSETITLYAQWNSESVSYTPESSKTGYNFLRWTDQHNNPIDSNYTPTQDITLFAVWYPITYDVVYNGNGSTSGSMLDSHFTYDESENLSKNTYHREYAITYDYNGNGQTNTTVNATATFNGWATSATGNVVYEDGHLVKNLKDKMAEQYNLYANWTLKSITLPTPETKSGYIFQGWYKKGTNENVGKGGATYTPEEDLTLQAHWEPNPSVTGTTDLPHVTGSLNWNHPASETITVVSKNTFELSATVSGVGTLSYEWSRWIGSDWGDKKSGTVGTSGDKISTTYTAGEPNNYYYSLWLTSNVDGSIATAQIIYFVQVQEARYAIIRSGTTNVLRYEYDLAHAYSDVTNYYTEFHLPASIRVEKDHTDESDVTMELPYAITLDTNGKTITRSKPIYVKRFKFSHLR